MISSKVLNKHILRLTSTRSLKIHRSFPQLQPTCFSTNHIPNMPLIDPVTTSGGGDKTQEWQNKLVGKKLGDASNEIVSYPYHSEPGVNTDPL